MLDLTNIDVQIASANEAARLFATKAKEAKAFIRSRLISGNDKPAREAAAKLKELADDQEMEEQRAQALAEHKAELLAEAEAARLKAARDDLIALASKRTAIAERAEKAIAELGTAVTDLSSLTTQLQLALAPAGIRGNAVSHEDLRQGIAVSLYDSGKCPWLLPQNPLGMRDQQGRLHTGVAKQVADSTAGLIALLKGD